MSEKTNQPPTKEPELPPRDVNAMFGSPPTADELLPDVGEFPEPELENDTNDALGEVNGEYDPMRSEVSDWAGGPAFLPDYDHVLPYSGQRAGKGVLRLLGNQQALDIYDDIVSGKRPRVRSNQRRF